MFRASEAHLVGIGVERRGLRTDELARILRARRVKLLFTTTAVQSPNGVVLSPALARAARAGRRIPAGVVEDDYDSEMRYGAPAPALKTLDRAGQVILRRHVLEGLFPGLRVGYLVAPRALPCASRCCATRWTSTRRP